MNRFVRIPPRKLLALVALVVEASFWLLVARLALLLLPFRVLADFLDTPLRHLQPEGACRSRQRKEVQWAINRAAGFLPGQSTCFARGIAAFRMCRARGIDSVLLYGANVSPTQGLRAHVWLRDGIYGITGHDVAADYRVIARFPASSSNWQ